MIKLVILINREVFLMSFNFEYFTVNDKSDIGDVKKQYKKLAFKHHPDVGGSVEAMQAVNSEYEQAIEYLKTLTGKKYSVDFDYMDIIEKLIKLNLQKVEIEICGWFVYVSGNTKPYKDVLKKAGLSWHSKRVLWYWKPSWYVKKDSRIWNMNEIRETFGSRVVTPTEQETPQQIN